jgi:hypothetical protein
MKQSDLGEYEEDAREKQTIQVYKIKHQLPLKPRQSESSPSNQVMWMTTPSSKLKMVARKAQGFSMQKTILPLNPRRNTTIVKFNQRCELPLKWRIQGFIK